MRAFLLALPLTLLLGTAAQAELIDRIVVTVGNQVITMSEMLDQLRMTAFLNGEKPVFTAESKRQAVDRLIEQKLVANEMALGRYPLPSAEDVQALLQQVRGARTETEFQRELQASGLTAAGLRQALERQLALIRFIDLRFRPAVQVTSEEIREQYNRQVANLGTQPAPRFSDVREQIRQTLEQERSNQQLDRWLQETRAQTRIEIIQDAIE